MLNRSLPDRRNTKTNLMNSGGNFAAMYTGICLTNGTPEDLPETVTETELDN